MYLDDNTLYEHCYWPALSPFYVLGFRFVVLGSCSHSEGGRSIFRHVGWKKRRSDPWCQVVF